MLKLNFINKENNKLDAQILVLTLLSLFIISIIAVALFNIANRDVEQTVQNREYTRLLSVAENRVIEVASVYAQDTVALGSITSQDPGCVQETTTKYTCTTNSGSVTTSTVLEELDAVIDYPLDKDQYIDIALNDYRGVVHFSYTGTAAFEFGILTRNTTTGAYKMYTDLFDLHGIFSSNGGDPFTDPLGNHFLNFVNAGGNTYNFTLGSSVPLNETILRMKITARKPTSGAVGLNLSGAVGAFPKFVRKFTATTYDSASATGIAATTTAIVPLTPQSFSIFDYALLTDGNVTKSAASF